MSSMVKPIMGATMQCKGASHKDKWLSNVKVTCHPPGVLPTRSFGGNLALTVTLAPELEFQPSAKCQFFFINTRLCGFLPFCTFGTAPAKPAP